MSMTASFEGFDLATGYGGNGTWVASLRYSETQTVDVLTFLRAVYAVPVARGNAVVNLDIVLAPPPELSQGAAFLAYMGHTKALPREGELIITDGDEAVVFDNAVRAQCRPERTGLSLLFPISFICGAPNTEPTLLQTMSPAYVNVLPSFGDNAITGPVGGDGKLDGVPTLLIATGRWVKFLDTTGDIDLPSEWQLWPTPEGVTETDLDAGIVFPLDHHETTNNRVWIKRG